MHETLTLEQLTSGIFSSSWAYAPLVVDCADDARTPAGGALWNPSACICDVLTLQGTAMPQEVYRQTALLEQARPEAGKCCRVSRWCQQGLFS